MAWILRLDPGEVMLAAAHNRDLTFAQRAGLGTALIPRPTELGAGQTGDLAIYAPLLLDDPAAAQSLRSQAKVAEALSCYDRINIAIVPIGSWDPPQSQLYDSITPQERRELLDAGVRADTSTVLLSRSGEILTPPLSQRLIGITGEQLRRTPRLSRWPAAWTKPRLSASYFALALSRR